MKTLAAIGAKPLIMTLASVDAAGRPHGRSVVCRRVGLDGTLWFASDSRSAKNAQLRATPFAEAVCWVESAREQYRFSAAAEIHGAETNIPDRELIWREMSGAARALFFWPPSGLARAPSDASFETSVEARRAAPPNFELILLRPDAVDHLNLTTLPHRRRRWLASRHWEVEELNP